MCAFKRNRKWHVGDALRYVRRCHLRTLIDRGTEAKIHRLITNTCVAYTHDAHDWGCRPSHKMQTTREFPIARDMVGVSKKLPIPTNKLSTRWTACFGFPEWLQGNRTCDNVEQARWRVLQICVESNWKLLSIFANVCANVLAIMS